MATHKSAEKRNRQSLVRKERNRAARTELRTAVKKARAAAAEGKPADFQAAMKQAESLLAKAAIKGVVHRKNASRRISRLAKLAKKDASAKK